MLPESREAARIPAVTHDISTLPAVFEAGTVCNTVDSDSRSQSEGSVCLLIEDYLFSGDTLMQNTLGRTDLPGGNSERLRESARKLMGLPPQVVVCGGGHGPRTTIAAEFSLGARVRGLL